MIFDGSYTVFNDFALAKEGAQDGFGGVGRTSRAAKDAKAAHGSAPFTRVSHP